MALTENVDVLRLLMDQRLGTSGIKSGESMYLMRETLDLHVSTCDLGGSYALGSRNSGSRRLQVTDGDD